MIEFSNAGASNCIELHGPAMCQLDWHDARAEYDKSVVDLLAAIRHCSALTLTDEEKCHLLEGARERERAAFIRYKRSLDAG
jgi:hypothetical protein